MKSRKRFESCHSGNANFDAADLNDANRDRAVARSTRPFSASLADLPVGYLLRLSLWGNSLLSKRTAVLNRFWPSCLFIVIWTFVNSEPAQGAYIISFTEQGGSVVANGSGSFDISSLRGQGIGGAGTSYTVAGFGDLLLGPGPTIYTILLWGPITGPSSYGTSFQRLASSASGGPVGLSIDNVGISLELNYLYVSGSSLPVTATWNNQTIGGMGLTPGVYNYTWGSDSLTIDIAQSSAPEPASVALFGIGCATLFITQRFLRRTR